MTTLKEKQKLIELHYWIETHTIDVIADERCDYSTTEVVKVTLLEEKLNELFGDDYP